MPLLESVGHLSLPLGRISAARRRGAARHLGELLERVTVELHADAGSLAGAERPSWNTSSSSTSSLRRRDSQSSAGRNSKNGMCGVTIASCAATATEMPVFHACGTTSRSRLGGHPRDAPRLGQPADPADVRLRDVRRSPVDQCRELVRVVSHSPCGDPDRRAPRELGVAVEVVDPERRLEEEDVERRRSPPRRAAPARRRRTRTGRRPSASSPGPAASRTARRPRPPTRRARAAPCARRARRTSPRACGAEAESRARGRPGDHRRRRRRRTSRPRAAARRTA